MPDRLDAAAILGLAASAGVADCRLANVNGLVARLDATSWFPEARRGREAMLPALSAHLPDPLSGSFLVCAFPYACDRPEDRDEPPAPGTAGLVAPFARRNYYRVAVKTLQGIASRAGAATGKPESAFRIFVNSRIPEKLIAYAAGLGWYGKNRLLFTDEYGSRFVIGLLFLPWLIEDGGDAARPQSPAEWCGACTACLDACPVNALRGGADLSACLKARSDALAPWDEAARRAWGVRFYGCDTCQAACPRNKSLTAVAAEEGLPGDVGPAIDIGSFLASSENEIRARFRKTALGMSWILPRALLRNALCAAGNSGLAGLLPAVRRYADDPRPLLADMARWAMGRIEAMRPS